MLAGVCGCVGRGDAGGMCCGEGLQDGVRGNSLRYRWGDEEKRKKGFRGGEVGEGWL